MSRFLERLAEETPIVADGGMGALLSSAVAGLRCPEEANLRAAESVLEVHLGYIRAGAELIETNSFGANRAKLERRFLADELEQIMATLSPVKRRILELRLLDHSLAEIALDIGRSERTVRRTLDELQEYLERRMLGGG